ncbi:hypothetical protein EW026_g1956 [Hermanssonia centrifuga]|uniref:Uncharacterized protein n=1 Tax=Hermanssonia centrifuga TaxID=98765 RepID=A0A4S4KUD0_9APHY|nr:hypothetical protein EW026_g1956 [Hermanssonia centrifuga]
MFSGLFGLLVLTTAFDQARGQAFASSPQDYTGKPSTDFSPEWQTYFQVTSSLPNVTFPLNRNWAGNIPVDRHEHPNNTLFFWGFEKENGSLTAAANEREDEPWGVWLNGGPGSSSMLGLLFENGPLHIQNNYSMASNNFSWHQLADYIWVDQPVGTGWSTCDQKGFVADEDQVGEDFPYITKAYFGSPDPPVNLAKIVIGDGTIGSEVEFEVMPVVTVIETYPQLVGYDTEVYEYFRAQSAPVRKSSSSERTKKQTLVKRALEVDSHMAKRNLKARSLDAGAERIQKRDQWKRDFVDQANETAVLDPYYGCDLYDELMDYALNFSLPWKGHDFGNGFDVYNIPDALSPQIPMDASVFLNHNVTRAALHAPSKDWVDSIFYPFGNSDHGDPSPEPMTFLSELAANASERNVGVLIYSGNDDSLVSHRSSEVVIQNTTFGGVQGYTRKPSTPWFDDNGELAGVVHQERNWTYVLVAGAGHLVPQQQPSRAYVILREFILGNNRTGLVVNTTETVSVVGGESSSLAVDVFPGQSGIYMGSGTTQSTYTFPAATVAAWQSFMATETATPRRHSRRRFIIYRIADFSCSVGS